MIFSASIMCLKSLYEYYFNQCAVHLFYNLFIYSSVGDALTLTDLGEGGKIPPPLQFSQCHYICREDREL